MSSSARPVSPRRSGTPPGSAIVVTLLFLAIITVLVVGMFSVMQPEQISATNSFANVRATALCQMAADQAVALIRGATTTAEAAANTNGVATNGGEFWASQPGQITVFYNNPANNPTNNNGAVDKANSVNLYSTSNVTPADASTTGTVDLNQQLFSGNYPIASPNSITATSGSAMNMNVQWINVLQDSTLAASNSNQVIGRYAFWVDDELAKINVNTADGTERSGTSPLNTSGTGNAYPNSGTNSFGFGTPTEVDLQALMTGGSTPISQATAQLISTRSGANPYTSGTISPFNDPSEILQATGASTLYSDNNFNLTAYNRAPEMNIFGEPKIFIMPTAYGPAQSAAASQYLANVMLGAYDYNGTWPLYWNTHTLSYTNTYVSGSTPLAFTGTTAAMVLAQPISQIYPSSGTNSLTFTSPKCNQLPIYSYLAASGTLTISGTEGLPQYFNYGYAGSDNALGMRIARYLEGLNSAGHSITWPAYPGASDPGTSGFAGKYTKRQIDSITQQILDIMDNGYFTDNGNLETYQTIRNGLLSNQLICGTSNVPRFTEIKITFSTIGVTGTFGSPPTAGMIPYLTISAYFEAYIPQQFTSANSHDGINNRDISWAFGTGGNPGQWLNNQDAPIWACGQTINGTQVSIYSPEPAVINTSGFATGGVTTTSGSLTEVSAVNGGSALNSTVDANGNRGTDFWQDNLLNITSLTDGSSAGFDLFGNDPNLPDPDPRALTYHPYAVSGTTAYHGYIMGTGVTPATAPQSNYSVLGMVTMVGTSTPWPPGQYHTVSLYHNTTAIPGRINVTGLKISGGISIWTHTASGTQPWDVVPLDSLHGPPNPSLYPPTPAAIPPAVQHYPQITTMNPYGGNLCWDGTNADPTANPITDPTFLQRVLSAVIPISGTIPVQVGHTNTLTVDMQVADPLVNKFPGDWVPSATAGTIFPVPAPGPTVSSGAAGSANTNFLATNGGDPSGFWFPPQYINIPKVQRFPSTGYFQYIRTGMMPDPATAANPSESAQKGTPFRMFNFAPSNSQSQQTSGGTSYPDWAMLDLFTVPAGFQPAYQLGAAVPSQVLFTWGGATSGRMNPNSALVSSTSSPFSFARTVPLQALLRNLQVSNSYAGDGLTPILSGTLNQSSIAAAINTYVALLQDANGNSRPMMLPGEICNVPTVSQYTYTAGAALSVSGTASRNDLVREIIGNLSTRSNTFTVWAVGQVIKKISSNTQYDRYQAGDVILGESRMKFLVERYVDYGVNAVPGNPYNAGSDTFAGTVDDYVGTGPGTGNYFSPPMTYPLQYKYRVVSASQISAK